MRSRKPENSLAVPLAKAFRIVFSSTPRESSALDLHREAEEEAQLGEAVTEQAGEL